MGKENEIQKTKLLIVEGNHERDFFQAWFQQLDIEDIQVMPIGGKTQLRNNLGPLVKRPAYRDVLSLVVMRDADDDPQAAFQSVADAFIAHGIPVPATPWILRQDATPKTGIVLAPRANAIGALEELLLETIQTDPLCGEAHQFIQNAVNTLRGNGDRNPSPAHKQCKARTHAYLATFEEPDKDPGKAALAGVWNFNHPCLQPLLQILQQM